MIEAEAKVLRLENGNFVLMPKTLRKRVQGEYRNLSVYGLGVVEVRLSPFTVVTTKFKGDLQFKALDFNSIHSFRNWIYFVLPNFKEIEETVGLVEKTIYQNINFDYHLLKPGIVAISPNFNFKASCPTSSNQQKINILGISEQGIISTQEETNQLYLHRIDEKHNRLILAKIIVIKTPMKILGLDRKNFYQQRAISGLLF